MHYPLPAEETDIEDIREIIAAHVEFGLRLQVIAHAWLDEWIQHPAKSTYAQWCEQRVRSETDKARRAATQVSWHRTRMLVFGRDGGRCHVCGRHIDHARYECGHIIDRVAGGCDRPSNLVVMCIFCNQAKPVHDTRAEYISWLESGAWMAEYHGGAPMIDLDAIEQAARAAGDNAYIVQTESFTYARFIKEATPATVLALIARLRAAEVEARLMQLQRDDLLELIAR